MHTVTEVVIERVKPQPIAAVRRRASRADVGVKIITGLDAVYAALRDAGLAGLGHNTVVYHNTKSDSFMKPTGVDLEIGVGLRGAFEETDEVKASTTPGGAAAHVSFFGPYEELGQGHGVIQRWAAKVGRKLAGPVWEIYGDWSRDPAQRRTDIFYLLEE